MASGRAQFGFLMAEMGCFVNKASVILNMVLGTLGLGILDRV